MIVCYIAAICPKIYFEKFEGEVSVAAYQFNRLLAQGLASVENVQVKCPVPISLLKRMEINELGKNIEEEGINYILYDNKTIEAGYWGFFSETMKNIKQWIRQDKVVVVTDALGIVADIVSTMAHLIYGIETVGIVTDLPQYVGNPQKITEKARCFINLFFMRRFQKYVLLTESMSEWVNKKNKYQCIVEGICDWNSLQENTEEISKYDNKVCMYAGSLHREYGIDMLIQGFLKAKVESSELHIYGKGNYAEEIENICRQHNNVVFYGQYAHDKILEEEKKVTLLVNPRPTNEEYTKYSFPSKTLEYMASGTPVLMTRLPGMPRDYEEYVYLFQNETVDGYAQTLREVLESKDKMMEKGEKARKFILSTRNNRVQAKKIIDELKID